MQTDLTIKGICTMQSDPYIRCYKNVLDENMCASLIRTYEKLWQEQEEFIKNLALSELLTIKESLSEFIIKNTIKTEEFPEEGKTEKQLLNEEKKNGK